MICSAIPNSVSCPFSMDLACQMERAAERCLVATGYPVLRQVRCEYRDGILNLRGRVPSYFLKQMAQSAVCACLGLGRVKNELLVASHEIAPEIP
jgi:hypothetical protein